MKLTIFGATGGTGQQLVQKALAAGHEVTAYARTPSKLTLDHENLKVLKGELSDLEKVAEAISGADAVLSGLGAVRGGSPEVMAPAATSILTGMKAHGVKRLVWATGAGVPAPEDQPAFINKVIGFLLKLTAREVLEDSLAGVEMIKTSELEWIIARCPMLTDEPGSGTYRTGYVNSEMGRMLSRENFADFMLKQIDSDEWLRKMPAVSDV
jgi:putative NADH-flavin reductase